MMTASFVQTYPIYFATNRLIHHIEMPLKGDSYSFFVYIFFYNCMIRLTFGEKI